MLSHQKALKVRIGIMFGNLKNLYGLKQSGQTWNKTFHTYLTTQNFVQSPVDPACMFKMSVIKYESFYCGFDDILITSKTEAHLMEIKTRLNSRFNMTDLGQLSWLLGIQFEYETNTRYIVDIINVRYDRLQTMLNSM